MNVGQRIGDSVQLKRAAHSASEGLNFQSQAMVLSGEMAMVVFWGLWATKGWICAPYSCSWQCKRSRDMSYLPCQGLRKTPVETTTIQQRLLLKELSYRGNPLPTPLSSNRISSTFPSPDSCFLNSVWRWGCRSLPRRYFSSASLLLFLEGFPQNLISICFIVN